MAEPTATPDDVTAGAADTPADARPGVEIQLGPHAVAAIKHATKLANRDTESRDDMSRTASEAVQLYAWLLERKSEGWTPAIADTDGTVHKLEMQ